MKNIIIKLKEDEDRSVIFKMPGCGRLDLSLALHPLKEGVINVSWEVRELKDKVKELNWEARGLKKVIKEAKSVGDIGKDERKESINKK